MKLLTIPQPRASLIVGGRIRCDTRTEPTDYRGTILIHAASSLRTELCLACMEQPVKGALDELGLTLATMPRGAIIGMGVLADVVEIRYSQDGHVLPPEIYEHAVKEIGYGDWRSGLWAYRFEKVSSIRAIEGVPGVRFPSDIRGALLDAVLESIADVSG